MGDTRYGDKDAKLAQAKAPIIFKRSGPACVKGTCSEGELTCGKPGEIREKFLNL